jgi:hypothetical protein
MDYNNELYGFYKQAKIADAFKLTSELIYSNNFEMLQKTFIRAVACIGEYTDVCFLKWYECIKDIGSFIENDDIDISIILKITAKICILFQNTVHYNVIPKTTITQLRNKVIHHFEDSSTKLSKKGEEFFETILPKPINERAFILKIIGALIKLWNEKKPIEFRDALEYLSRKDYIIESIHTETGSGIVAFLWEFLKVYEPLIATNIYMIYKTDYKKKDKIWRNALLFGMHNYLNGRYNTVLWDEEEKIIIKNGDSLTRELWSRILKVENTPSDRMSLFDTYYPVKIEKDGGEEEYIKEPRTIRFK